SYETSASYSKGIVIRQSPGAGGESTKGSSVSIVVSTGKVTTQKLTINLGDYDKSTPAKSVKVKVYLYSQEGEEKNVYEGTNMSNDSFTVNVEGYGREIYEIFIDGVSVGSNYIDF
ncbi:MAG: PASTA domain-containing protein, partial [Eubacteriaceae bacterium]